MVLLPYRWGLQKLPYKHGAAVAVALPGLRMAVAVVVAVALMPAVPLM